LYIQCQSSLSFRFAGGGLCFGHHPSRVSSGQPGFRQGRSGLRAIHTSWAKTKTPEPTHPGSPGIGSGAGLSKTLAQALVDIHGRFSAAFFAVNDQVFGSRVPGKLQDLPSPADRTNQPTILHDECITLFGYLQLFPPLFYAYLR
jgi:hypothetical protein